MKTTLLFLLILQIISSGIPLIGAAEYEAGTQIAPPEGALARLGKGDANLERVMLSVAVRFHFN